MLRRVQLLHSAARAFSSSVAPISGTLYMCGTGESNKLGLGDTKDREVPVLVEALADVKISHVACGKYHSAALSTAGDVYMWGDERCGQLGLGKAKAPTPTKVEALSGIGVTQLSCGMYHTLALTEAGEVYSCGFGGSFFNGAGGLGHGNRKQLNEPTKLAGFGHGEGQAVCTNVSAGGYHSVALDTEGRVWTWGRGEWGRLGHDDASDALVPTVVLGQTGGLGAEEGAVRCVGTPQAGEGHTGALGEDGLTYTWGRNEHWQLGYEVVGLLNSGQSFDAQQSPLAVPIADKGAAGTEDAEPTTAYTARRFACGEQGSAAQLSDGSVYIWGMQRFFEPTRVPGYDAALGGAELQDMQLGATHLALHTAEGKVFTFGSGTALGLAKADRKSWELGEVTAHSFDGQAVLRIACGPHSTAFLVD